MITAPRSARLAARAAVLAAALAAGSAAAQAPIDPSRFSALAWRSLGPARGGRVTTVTGVPQEPHTFYFGSTGGGVWKTTDAGISWLPVSDGQVPVGSIGDIDVADGDPGVVYVGTGSDGLRSNVSIGKGVWKSLDAGKTWRFAGLPDAGNIGAVRVHPTNPDIVFVAAIGNPFRPNPERGVFRTMDGGRSWDRVLFLSDSTGAVDVEFMPGNPQVVYAALWRAERKPWTIISGAREGGIWKSTDGGASWRQVTAGLPHGLVGKANIAVTPARPARVYVLLEASPGGGLYRSDDAGESFERVSDEAQLITRPFYYTNITAHPTNPDEVYVGTEGFHRSTDGGRTWTRVPTPHGDNHDLWINPLQPAVMVQSNDGGANVTLDAMRSWSTQYNQPTAEIYQVYVDQRFPYRLYGAQQDNSTLIVPSLPPTQAPPDDPVQAWQPGAGCETGPIMPHPVNPDTVYGSCKGQFSRLNLRTGQEKQYWIGAQSLYGNPGKDLVYRFQRVSPMEVSPHDPRVLYYGSQHVHRTRDEGVTWEVISPDLTWNPPERQQRVSGEPITIDVTGEEYYSTLYAIRESPLERGVIWTGANDGPFHVTRDGGRSWRMVTPPAQPAGCRVQNIEPSPHRRGSAYYAVLCYLLGDFRPFLWRTDDYGASWTLLTPGTNGIPADHPTRVVREDPERAGLLYAGTEFGVFVSADDGATWQPLQLNLPVTPVTDLKVHRGDLVISTQGRGFWILDNVTPLRQAPALAGATPHLFRPRDAYRMRYRGDFGSIDGQLPRPSNPQYPPAGAQLDYWLPADSLPVTLEILDGAGTVLRRFTSAGAGEAAREPAEPGMRRPAMEVVGTPRLPDRRGHNRFTWNLELPGPWTADTGTSGRNGPMVLPGAYTVRLTQGATVVTQPLTVRLDPRLPADGITAAVLAGQLAHNLRARDLLSEANRLVAEIAAERARLAGDTGTAAVTRRERLDAARAKLVSPPVRYSKPALREHIAYLYEMTLKAEQQVSRDALDRERVLRAALDAVTAELR